MTIAAETAYFSAVVVQNRVAVPQQFRHLLRPRREPHRDRRGHTHLACGSLQLFRVCINIYRQVINTETAEQINGTEFQTADFVVPSDDRLARRDSEFISARTNIGVPPWPEGNFISTISGEDDPVFDCVQFRSIACLQRQDDVLDRKSVV